MNRRTNRSPDLGEAIGGNSPPGASPTTST